MAAIFIVKSITNKNSEIQDRKRSLGEKICICTSICMCTCMYVCMYVYIHIHLAVEGRDAIQG